MKLGIGRESRAIVRGGANVGVCPCLLDQEEQGNAAVGADVITTTVDTTSDVIKLLGWGLLGWVALKYVVPEFVGAAGHTKRKTHEYSMIDRRERERREDRNDEKRARKEDRERQLKASRGSYHNDDSVHDAEFEENNTRIRAW